VDALERSVTVERSTLLIANGVASLKAIGAETIVERFV